MGYMMEHHREHTYHEKDWWKGENELKIGDYVIVNYQPCVGYPHHCRVEQVTYIQNNSDFITKVVPDRFNFGPHGMIGEVHPYTPENIEIYQNSQRRLELERMLKCIPSMRDILPDDMELAIHLCRMFKEMKQRKLEWSRERLRDDRKKQWDMIHEAYPDYDSSHLYWNNPYNDDWDQHPKDHDFRDSWFPNYHTNDIIANRYDMTNSIRTSCYKPKE